MSYTTNSKEVADAIALLNVSAKILSEDFCTTILNRVIEKFTNSNKYHYPLWENIVHQKAIKRQYAWEVFNKMLKDKEIILLFDYGDDKNMFLFSDGGNLTEIFANCFKFIFYVTNMDNEFLIAYNDHDYLIGSGVATKWIDDMELGKYDFK